MTGFKNVIHGVITAIKNFAHPIEDKVVALLAGSYAVVADAFEEHGDEYINQLKEIMLGAAKSVLTAVKDGDSVKDAMSAAGKAAIAAGKAAVEADGKELGDAFLKAIATTSVTEAAAGTTETP